MRRLGLKSLARNCKMEVIAARDLIVRLVMENF